MAKKPPSVLDPEPSALDDPFAGGDLPERAPAPPPPPRSGPTCGQIVGGFFEILIIAAIIVLSCGLLSGALVWLGQDRGLVAAAPPTPAPALLAAVPTVEPLNVPTLPAVIPTSAPTEDSSVPSGQPTPAAQASVCADGAAWWRDQQSTFDDFASVLPGLPYGGDNPAALQTRLRPRRDALAATAAPACLEAPQAALLRGMDATLAGVAAAAAGDNASMDASSAEATAAFAGVLTALWDLGVFTAPDAPTTRSIARGSAGDCAPDDWYADLAQQWAAFASAAAAADPRTASSLTINLRIGEMNTIIEDTRALDTPACVSDIGDYALAWMTATTDALRAQVAGDTSGARTAAENAGRSLLLLRAWQDWLGLPPL